MASCKPYDFNWWLQNDPARRPAAKPIPALPRVATRISRKRFLLDENDLGLLSISFSFLGEYTGAFSS
jgi:hypothetical protein